MPSLSFTKRKESSKFHLTSLTQMKTEMDLTSRRSKIILLLLMLVCVVIVLLLLLAPSSFKHLHRRFSRWRQRAPTITTGGYHHTGAKRFSAAGSAATTVARHEVEYPWARIKEVHFNDRRFIPVRESAEKEQEQRQFLQSRRICEPYSPRAGSGSHLAQYTEHRACRTRASDLVAFQFPRAPLSSSFLSSRRDLFSPSSPAKASEIAFCLEQEIVTAQRVQADIARERPALAAEVAKVNRVLAQRRVKRMRQKSKQRHEKEETPKEKKNVMITFSLKPAAADAPRSLEIDTMLEQQTLVYTFLSHAVPGRDVLLYVVNRIDEAVYEMISRVHRTVVWERHLLLKQSGSSSFNTTPSVDFSPVTRFTKKVLGERHSLIHFPPWLQLMEVRHFWSQQQSANQSAQQKFETFTDIPSNARVFYLEKLLGHLMTVDWLNNNNVGRLIVVDSRDAVVFSNPFDALRAVEKDIVGSRTAASVSAAVYVVAEERTLFESDINRWWNSVIVGKEAEAHLIGRTDSRGHLIPRATPDGRPLPVLCSGVIAANSIVALRDFVTAHGAVLRSVREGGTSSAKHTMNISVDLERGVDQPALAVLFLASGLVDFGPDMDLVVLDPLVAGSFARHAFRHEDAEDWPRAAEGSACERGFFTCHAPAAGGNSTMTALFHQADRHDFWAEIAADIKSRIMEAHRDMGMFSKPCWFDRYIERPDVSSDHDGRNLRESFFACRNFNNQCDKLPSGALPSDG